jgi:hypothetical protein
MSYELIANILGTDVSCRTEGQMLCLNDLLRGFNIQRLQKGQAAMQLGSVLRADALKAYMEEAALVWGVPEDSLIKQVKHGRGINQSRTFGHISVALYLAEVASPAFHAAMHKEFVEGRLLQFREQGGTEFKRLNSAIDKFLPGREGRDNKGCYINAAKIIRNKVTNTEEADAWTFASAQQQELRVKHEQSAIDMLRLGMVRDWEHLKETLIAL